MQLLTNNEYQNLKGSFRTNLYYIKQFYEFCNQFIVPQVEGQFIISQQFVDQLLLDCNLKSNCAKLNIHE